MIRCGVAIILLASACGAAAQSFVVPAELWDRPRSGQAVLETPAIRQAVGAWLANPGAELILRHGAAQESVLAAEELRAWLSALAIESARISLQGGLGPAEPMRIEVVKGSDRGKN